MIRQSFEGRRIVVTRPAEQADSLCRAIEARGGVPILFPVLAIAPVVDDHELMQAITRLDEYDLAFFVSPNAVCHALDRILAHRAWPATLAVATVGAGSAKALHERGFDHVIVPENGFDSEAVLALPAFGADRIAGRRVLILRGDGGRELLGDSLIARGASVDRVTCYRRFRPDADAAPLLGLARQGRLDAITLTSSEGVRNFVTMLGAGGVEVLRHVPVFAPHPRIASFACEDGFVDVVVTAPGDTGLLAALEARFGVGHVS